MQCNSERIANFCAFHSLEEYGRGGWNKPKPTARQALSFVISKIKLDYGCALFFGGPAGADGGYGIIHDIGEQLPKKFSFKHNGMEYNCKVSLSRKYHNYNSGNTVKHCIIQWTKKRIPRNGAKKAPRN